MPKKTDRRIERTRALLQGALNSMIVEKGYEATTVQDIIDRANVGRATFYAHFADKESLLVSRLADLRASLKHEQARSLAASGEAAEHVFGFSRAMLEHARNHWTLYQAMAGRKSGSIVLQRIQVMLTELVRDDLRALGFKVASAQQELVAQYVTGAFMGVMLWWLDRGVELSPQAIDDIFRQLVMEGLAAHMSKLVLPGSTAKRK